MFKRVDAAANSGGSDINTRLTNGLPIGSPVSLVARITDYDENLTDYASAYEIDINGRTVDSGMFRFNNSTSARYLIFDVAAHQGTVHYDNVQVVVSAGGTSGVCRKPVLSFSDLTQKPQSADLRMYWVAQPALTVTPEISHNLSSWVSMTNSNGSPLTITTPHGSIQWLHVTSGVPTQVNSFIRLNKN